MDKDDWEEEFDETEFSHDPGEALQREIERSKAMKVERLKLRNNIEALETQNTFLREQNQKLEAESHRLKEKLAGEPGPSHRNNALGPASRAGLPARWALYLLMFNLTSLGVLLYFILQK